MEIHRQSFKCLLEVQGSVGILQEWRRWWAPVLYSPCTFLVLLAPPLCSSVASSCQSGGPAHPGPEHSCNPTLPHQIQQSGLLWPGVPPWLGSAKPSGWTCPGSVLCFSPAKAGGCTQSAQGMPLNAWPWWPVWLVFLGSHQTETIRETVLGRLLPSKHCTDSRLKHAPVCL